MQAIGEAGEGHSFTSKAEGPIPFRHKGEQLPLFTRVIYAEQVSENIMSVPEACDHGFSFVFTREGVKMYKAEDCHVQGQAVLTGTEPVSFTCISPPQRRSLRGLPRRPHVISCCHLRLRPTLRFPGGSAFNLRITLALQVSTPCWRQPT